VIEAIVQVCRLRPGARVLACAPSDTAADILADRLSAYFDEKKVGDVWVGYLWVGGWWVSVCVYVMLLGKCTIRPTAVPAFDTQLLRLFLDVDVTKQKALYISNKQAHTLHIPTRRCCA
jgi:hypothetical protein